MKMFRSAVAFVVVAFVVGGCSNDPKPNVNNIISDTPRDFGNDETDAGDGGDVGDGGLADAATMPDGGGLDGGVDAADVCIPENDVEMCLRYDFECGPLQNLDNCGVMRTIDSCGDEVTVCMESDTCGGSGTPGTCGCTIATCEDLGVLCGEVADTCGGTLNCNLFCVDEITAGGGHGCAIGSGKIKCWGRGGDGQLGNGGTGQQKNPVDVTGLTTTVSHASAGIHHTCAIDSAGRVLCWGDNARGQLGIGTTVDAKEPGTPAIFSGADQVVAGEFHVCARSGGKVECWGANDYGQIGNPNFNIGANVGVPTQVDGLATDVVTVTSGRNHICALQNDPANGLTNVLKCWGRNRFGQVGTLEPNALSGAYLGFIYSGPQTWDIDTMERTPQTIPDPENPLQPWSNLKAVAAGGTHTCVIDSTDRLWCWGFIGGFDPVTSCPKFEGTKSPKLCGIFPRNSGVFIASPNATGGPSTFEAYPVAYEPVLLELGGKTPTALAAGDEHHCMIISNPDAGASNILCFGRNEFGQLGDGTNNNWSQPHNVFLDVNGNPVTATQIAAGDKHTCAVVDNSNVKCWGSNADGQIGNSALLRDESYRPYDVRLAP